MTVFVEGIATVDDVDDIVATLSHIGDESDCTVQAFDARYVVSREHLERALELADRAIDRGENVARDRGVEMLLYAAGRRQIDRALAMGVDSGEQPVVVVVDPAPTGNAGDAEVDAAVARVRDLLEPADTMGEYDESVVCEYFDISDRERRAAAGDLASLVLERVALLDVEK